MNQRERCVKAIYKQTPDRVPCAPLIDISYAASIAGIPVSECFLDPTLHTKALVETLKRHPEIDGLSVNICLSNDVIVNRQEDKEGFLVETIGGVTWRIPWEDVGSIISCRITSFDDPRLETADFLSKPLMDTLRGIPTETRERYLIAAGVTGPFSQIIFLMGLENVMVSLLDNPAMLRNAIDKRLQLTMDWVEEMSKLNPGCMWIGEGTASSNLISPSQYRDFVLPYEKEVATKMCTLNIPSLLHICGDITPILDLIPDTGCDCLELDWPVNLLEAKRRIGDRMSLKGNINTTTLTQSSEQEIYELSLKCIQDASQGGGFILSSGCCLGRDTPPANVDTMVKVAQKHGVYS